MYCCSWRRSRASGRSIARSGSAPFSASWSSASARQGTTTGSMISSIIRKAAAMLAKGKRASAPVRRWRENARPGHRSSRVKCGIYPSASRVRENRCIASSVSGSSWWRSTGRAACQNAFSAAGGLASAARTPRCGRARPGLRGCSGRRPGRWRRAPPRRATLRENRYPRRLRSGDVETSRTGSPFLRRSRTRPKPGGDDAGTSASLDGWRRAVRGSPQTGPGHGRDC